MLLSVFTSEMALCLLLCLLCCEVVAVACGDGRCYE